MIQSDFYADSTLFSDVKVTDTISNLNITDKTTDPLHANYMGNTRYIIIHKGNFSALKSGETENSYVFKFKSGDTPNNWSYVLGDNSNPISMQYNGSKYTGNLKLVNAMKAYNLSLNYGASFNVSGYVYDFSGEQTLGNGEHIRTASTRYSASFSLSGDSLWSFFHDGGTATITANSVEYELKLTDWKSKGCYFNLGSNKRFYVEFFGTPNHNNNTTYYNNNSTKIQTAVTLDTSDILARQGTYMPGCFLVDPWYMYADDMRLDFRGNQLGRFRSLTLYGGERAWCYSKDKTTKTAILGKDFEISYIAANYASDHSSLYIINDNNDLFYSTGSDQIALNRFIDLPAVYACGVGCIPKATTSKDKDGNTVIGYSNNTSTYEKYHSVPIFSPSNVYIMRIKRDKYSELEPKLRNWQKYGFNINDDLFDPDDNSKPPAGDNSGNEPDDPTREDQKDDGKPPTVSRTSHQPVFTKYYVMTPTVMMNFMTALTAQITDSVNAPNDTTKFLYKVGEYYNLDNKTTYVAPSDHHVSDFICSLRFYPIDIHSLSGAATTQFNFITFGYRGAILNAHTAGYKLDKELYSVPEFTVTVNNKKGNTEINECTFEDFEPYSEYTIHLPYLGDMPIPAHNAVCATISVWYTIDFSTGMCAAAITAEGGFNSTDEETPYVLIGMKTGQIGMSLSISGNDAVAQADAMASAYMNQISSRLGLTKARIGMAQTAVNTAVDIGENAANFSDKGFAPGVGAAQSAVKGGFDIANSYVDMQGAKLQTEMADYSMAQASRSVPFHTYGGSQAGAAVHLQQVSVSVKRVPVYRPDTYGHTFGYPSDKTSKIQNVSGFFKAINPDISGLSTPPPTEVEQAMISKALQEGSFK